MDEGIVSDFARNGHSSSVSKTKTTEEDLIKTEILQAIISSSDFLNLKTVSFKSQIVVDGSSKNSLEEIIEPNSANVKTSLIETSLAKISGLVSVKESTKSKIEIEELLESVNQQTEEIEEMLTMISRAKEKLEFFVFHIEYLVKSLQEISKCSTPSSKTGNTYLKKIYRKKLEEFASGLLNKVNLSIKDLEAHYVVLKQQEEKMKETFDKIVECDRISDTSTTEINTKNFGLLGEIVDDLVEEIGVLKPKQLSEIEKVSYIETDIEMLHDLYRRFSGIEGSNLISF